MSANMNEVKNGMRPIHPGEILREEFLIPMKLSAHALAMATAVPAPRINDIVRERRAVSADTTLHLARYFDTSAEYWMGLQTDYDLRRAEALTQDALARIQRIAVSA
jgi:addiction module HigA family antidote